ncbi:MAG: hypothetical protein O2780_16920 [Proteobacteria bacterium]|nr:hypothetical protein [Pseudomonadota bacterium]
MFRKQSAMFRPIRIYLIALLCTLPGVAAFAAHDGIEGKRSTGSIGIRLNINQGIQVVNLSDIDLSTTQTELNGDLSYESEFCIRGQVGASYRVTTTSSLRDSNGFALVGDAGDSLNYRLVFKSSLIAGAEEALNPNGISRTYTLTNESSGCSQGNASITVIFDANDVRNATSEEYTGTIFVAIEMV